MTSERTLIAIAVVLAGVAVLARKAGAAEVADQLEEIEVTPTLRTGSLFDQLTDAITDKGQGALGLRSNNPMNVRETAITWQGELPHDGDGYENFDTAANGIRAGCRVLVNYYRLHSINTIRGIISRWAPPSDNNPTDAYIKFVAMRLLVPADAPLDMQNADAIAKLAEAIIAFENGEQPFTMSFIRDQAKRAL